MESNTIMRYIGDIANSPMYPRERMERAQVEQWMDFFSQHSGRHCLTVWFQKSIAPKFFNLKTDEHVVEIATKALLDEMPVVDAPLAKNQWFAGSDYTLADTAAYTMMKGYCDAGLNFADFKNFNRWFEAVAARPAVKMVFEKF